MLEGYLCVNVCKLTLQTEDILEVSKYFPKICGIGIGKKTWKKQGDRMNSSDA